MKLLSKPLNIVGFVPIPVHLTEALCRKPAVGWMKLPGMSGLICGGDVKEDRADAGSGDCLTGFILFDIDRCNL